MAVHEKHSTNQHQKQYMHLTVFERGCSVTIDVTPTTIQKRLSPIEF